MVPSPSTTLFWVAGAFNYSWAFLFCVLVLCLFRFTYKGKQLKNTWYINVLIFFIGLSAGMSNENTGPMMFGISLCFILFCKYKKIQIPKYIYFAFFGTVLGITLLFGLGGSYRRLHENYIYTFFVNSDLINKLLFSVHHLNKFLKALYFVPVIIFTALLLIAYDKKNGSYQKRKIYFKFVFPYMRFCISFCFICGPFSSRKGLLFSRYFLFNKFFVFARFI